MDNLDAKSALAAEYKPGTHGVATESPLRLAEKRVQSMVHLAVFETADFNAHLHQRTGLSLPQAGKSGSTGELTLLWTGPGRYLLVGEDRLDLEQLVNGLEDGCAMVQDLGCARTLIRVQGEHVPDLMAKGLTVAMDEQAFAPGDVVLSSFDHHFPAIIHNVSAGEPAVDIYITRSFALSFWQWLCDAALEYGYRVDDIIDS